MKHCMNMDHVCPSREGEGVAIEAGWKRSTCWASNNSNHGLCRYNGSRGKFEQKVVKEFSEISTRLTFSWQHPDKVPKGARSLHFQWEVGVPPEISLSSFDFSLSQLLRVPRNSLSGTSEWNTFGTNVVEPIHTSVDPQVVALMFQALHATLSNASSSIQKKMLTAFHCYMVKNRIT